MKHSAELGGLAENTPQNIARPNHLIEGVNPIMSCLMSVEDCTVPDLLSEDVEGLDLYEGSMDARAKGIIKEGKMSYAISPIDSNAKFSQEYLNCSGVVVVGIDRGNGKNISFMSHQNPSFFLHEDEDKFKKDFISRLKEINVRCKKGTIDAVIFGGQFFKIHGYDDNHEIQKFFKDEYASSLKLLSDLIISEMGFVPNVVGGPKVFYGSDTVVFDNDVRRLFVRRDVKNSHIIEKQSSDYDEIQNYFKPNFAADEIDDRSKGWTPGEINIAKYLKSERSKRK